MAYSEFTIPQLKEKFGLRLIENTSLFQEAKPFPVPARLQELLDYNIPLALAMDTEKARSELIIAPVLVELKRQFDGAFSLFSGPEFNVDPALGLVGRCDFILSKSEEQLYVDAPLVVMVEAKNDRIKDGIPQCLAEMIGAQRFNREKANSINVIYGVVSTGSNWRFLKLEGETAFVDEQEYYLNELDQVLGILKGIVIS